MIKDVSFYYKMQRLRYIRFDFFYYLVYSTKIFFLQFNDLKSITFQRYSMALTKIFNQQNDIVARLARMSQVKKNTNQIPDAVQGWDKGGVVIISETQIEPSLDNHHRTMRQGTFQLLSHHSTGYQSCWTTVDHWRLVRLTKGELREWCDLK